MANPLLNPVLAWLGRLRNPHLFAVAAALFLVDLAVPDLLPFVDELLLGMLTLWLGSRRHERRQGKAGSGKLH